MQRSHAQTLGPSVNCMNTLDMAFGNHERNQHNYASLLQLYISHRANRNHSLHQCRHVGIVTHRWVHPQAGHGILVLEAIHWVDRCMATTDKGCGQGVCLGAVLGIAGWPGKKFNNFYHCYQGKFPHRKVNAAPVFLQSLGGIEDVLDVGEINSWPG